MMCAIIEHLSIFTRLWLANLVCLLWN